jgi:hypothetical protein
MIEEWRPVSGYEKYLVSNLGRVQGPGRRNQGATILNPTISIKGYRIVRICSGGKWKGKSIHRLVIETFVGPCPSGMECAHLDGDPGNNVVTNLKWCSRRENGAHKKLHGTQPYGEDIPGAKLTPDQVREIRRDYFYIKKGHRSNVLELAKRFGISCDQVLSVAKREYWKHVPDDPNQGPAA